MSDGPAPAGAEKHAEIPLAGVERMAQPEVDAALAYVPAAQSRGPFYALTFRNFRLFFIGQLISVAGTWMQTVAQNWVVWDLTKDPRWLGFVSAANAIPYVLFSMWGGHLADRHSKRTILIVNQTAQMILAFALAVLATNRLVKMEAWHIVLLSGLLGLSSAFNMPAQQAFVVELVDRRDALGNAIALSSLRFNLARVAGPMLAGLALQKFGAAVCFGVNGMSFIAVIICLWMMHVPQVTPTDHKMHVLEGFRYILRTRRVLRIILLIGGGSLFTWSVSTLFPMLADVMLHRQGPKGVQAGFTLIMIFNGVGAAVGAGLLAAAAGTAHRRLQVYGGSGLFCVALLVMSFSSAFWQVIALLVVSGFAMIVFGMASQTLVQEEVPDELRGRVMAVYSLVFQGLFPVGGLEMGFLANRFGAFAAIRINAIVCLVITLLIYAWSVSARRRLEAAAEPAR
ncbi:MAG TPA: MFS transporter [Chthonomonadaceae bacterium]|nr:MFS transporter [Chthonomonadaceae bacterium]